MARAFLRTVPAEPEESDDFKAARERWLAASARRRELVDALAGAQAALGLLAREDDDPAVPPRVAEAAARFLAGRKLSQRRLQREIEDLEDALAAAAPGHAAAAEDWRQAQSTEAARRVTQLRPRHRAAVAAIARAVQSLSDALDLERGLHRELAEAGLGVSASLSDACYPFKGSLTSYHSDLSHWSRRVRELGLLD